MRHVSHIIATGSYSLNLVTPSEKEGSEVTLKLLRDALKEAGFTSL
jgi:hypothetical protein